MHCSPVCVLATAVLLLACLQGVRSLECYKCYTKSSRRTDSCYLGVPTKGLERDVCKGSGRMCIVAKRYVERLSGGSWLIETTRGCMQRQDAAVLCPSQHVEAVSNTSTGAAQPTNITRSTCSRCYTSLCNSGALLRPDRLLRWFALVHVLLLSVLL